MEDQSKQSPDEQAEHYEQEIKPARANVLGHSWRQQGPYLVCRSCPFEHTFTPTDHNGHPLLLNHTYHGMDAKGEPILKRINV